MAKTFSIPQLMRMTGIRGYNPALAVALNRMLQPRDASEYAVAKREATRLITGYDNVRVADVEAHQNGPVFGLPLFMPLTLEAFDEQTEDFVLDSAIVEISRTKNIVVTVVQGRDTSVKEFINNGDYGIKISGILAGDWRYPAEDVKRLNDFLSHKGSLKVVHDKLNGLGIYEIVITDYAFPPVPLQNVQPYTITAISDEPVELVIDDL